MKNKKVILLIGLLAIITSSIIVFIMFNTNNSDSIGSSGISLNEFEQIQLGMDQFKVNSIIDPDNLWNDDEIYNKACIELSKENNNSVYTYKYKYIGETSGYAIIIFTVDYSNGIYGLEYPKVTSKENFNLK